VKVGFKEDYLVTSVGKDGLVRTTLSVLTYYSEVVRPQLILVPIGTVTDFGSIPKFLQSIFSKDGLALYAYVLHDYLYRTGMFTRSECDMILEEAMKSLGVAWWRRKAVRGGLRIGGWVAWNKHRNKKKGGK